MRILVAAVAATTLAGTALVTVGAATAAPAASTTKKVTTEYVVLARTADGAADAAKAVRAVGGTVVETNASLGYVVARSTSSRFARAVAKEPNVVGAARNQVIGKAPKDVQAPRDAVERMTGATGARKAAAGKGKLADPLSPLQWDMKQIDATATGSYKHQKGRKGVLVGVIDTGIDGTHPDIKANFDAKLSRNFTTDIADIDTPEGEPAGTCEHPESGCKDPANEDDDGHGTHVASTIASPLNGLGIAGVAPKVTLVNIRAGQDSGYFFLQPTLDALTYAGKIGVDVVNMSYYTDPWLYNCKANPADSPEQQQEQRVVIQATQRALNFARHHGVLPVAAEGNEATDLNLPEPIVDDTSPDYPADAAYDRTVDNSCISVPTENKGVVAVSSTGPSTRKAYYSNYGTQETDVAAPGGDAYDNPEQTRQLAGTVLAAYPRNVGIAAGTIDPATGDPTTSSVVKACKGSVCGYYQYLQGTSMASPHAVGVAALIVSEYGHKARGGGLTLNPSVTQRILYRTAAEHACPNPRTYHYVRNLPSPPNPPGTVATADATCAGGRNDNGFYGHGIVNALAAVS